jgi:DNA-directed RNA polymerase subunit H (RpoH/RPB5)
MCEYVNRHDVVTYALDAEELYNMLEQYIINVAWVPKIE